jgi:GTP cyclohydrolase II
VFDHGRVDARFQVLMPDVLHWLGVKKIDNVSLGRLALFRRR